MGKQNKRKQQMVRRNDKPLSLPWWRKVSSKLILIPLGTIVAIVALAHGYKTTGANDLRTQVYQPLFADIVNVEESVQAISIEKPAIMKSLPELKRSGAFELIPRQIQTRVLNISEATSKIDTAVNVVAEIVLREMSARIIQIRTEEADKDWKNKTGNTLREMSKSKKGIADRVSFSMNHEGRSPAVDVRNPNQPEIAGPGGPAFVVRDWLEYPSSITMIENLWTDVDYLYFNERDSWYYQLTREDLRRLNLSLADFLKPVYQILSKNGDFQFLIKTRPVLLSEISALKAVLADRVRDPKQLRDLLSY